MFTRTDAYEIVTRNPARSHRHKSRRRGARDAIQNSRDPTVWMFRDRIVDCHVWSFRIQDWVSRTPELENTGAWLHDRMEAEAKRIGIDAETHDPDPNHNRYVGAAVEMVFGSHPEKAVTFYNRWVTASRHMRDGKLQHVSLVATDPPVIRFDIGLMRSRTRKHIEVIREC